MEFNAGPIDDSVLHRQGTHISTELSKNNLDKTLRVRRSDNIISKLCGDGVIHHRVLARLNDMGFYGIIRCGFFKYDNHLITALVERWRRETHTFHLRVGEATITLQDVELVWDLNINGFSVTGVDESFKPHVWQTHCVEWLGFMPQINHFRGNKLVMSVLDQFCRSSLIHDNSSNLEVERYTRCVALMIIGGCMLPDSDGCSVNLMYLRLLRDINQASKYSWGSAVLAFLYRELCTASTIGKGEIAGPIFILQVWALSRITFLCPDPFGDIPDDDEHDDQILPFPPFGERWNRYFTWTHTTNHSVRVIRDLLDKMEPNQFKWVLYSNEFDKEYWRSVCPLICFHIVEMHRPDRVLRQFGQLQHIPSPAFDGDDFHECTRQGRRNHNWAEHHKNSIVAWADRFNLIVEGEPATENMGMTRDYAMWYDKITRRFITPIDPQAEYGYRPGDANFRCVMRNDAEVLRSWFHGLSLQDQPREALESAITETIKIGERFCVMLDSTSEPNRFQELPHPHPHHNQEPRHSHHFEEPIEPHWEFNNEAGTSHSTEYHVSSQQVHMNEDRGFQTPNEPYNPSFTDMIIGDYGWNENEMNSNYNVSPIPFPRYSDIWSMRTPNNQIRGNVNDEDSDEEDVNEEEENVNDEDPGDGGIVRRKGKRVKRRPNCGTGGCL